MAYPPNRENNAMAKQKRSSPPLQEQLLLPFMSGDASPVAEEHVVRASARILVFPEAATVRGHKCNAERRGCTGKSERELALERIAARARRRPW